MKNLVHSAGSLGLLAALVVILWAGSVWQATPAVGEVLVRSVQPSCLIGLEVCSENLFVELPDMDKIVAVPHWLDQFLYGKVEEHLFELLAEESWGVWENFQKIPGSHVPMAEAGHVLRWAHEGFLPKRPSPYYARESGKTPKVTKERKAATGSSAGEALLTLFQQPPTYYRKGLFAPAHDRQTERSVFNPFRWLSSTSEEFSMAEWDTADFLGRIGVVAGFVLGGLALIELFHYFVRMGRDRGDSSGSPD